MKETIAQAVRVTKKVAQIFTRRILHHAIVKAVKEITAHVTHVFN